MGYPCILIELVAQYSLDTQAQVHIHHTCKHTHTHVGTPTYIELVSLHDLGWRVVVIIMGLVVLVPLVALGVAEGLACQS